MEKKGTTKRVAAAIASLLMAIATFRYCQLIVLDKVHPVFATWLFFSLAVSLGIWTYMQADSAKDPLINIANTADVFSTWSILIFLLLFGKEVRYGFSFFETICLFAIVSTLIYWRLSKRAGFANIAINVILFIGYWPTIIELWGATKNTESFFVWIFVFLSSLVALYNSVKERGGKRDKLSVLYASRAVVMVGIIIGLMAQIEFFK